MCFKYASNLSVQAFVGFNLRIWNNSALGEKKNAFIFFSNPENLNVTSLIAYLLAEVKPDNYMA